MVRKNEKIPNQLFSELYKGFHTEDASSHECWQAQEGGSIFFRHSH